MHLLNRYIDTKSKFFVDMIIMVSYMTTSTRYIWKKYLNKKRISC